MRDFIECPTCAARPGTPLLCPSCVHNRNAISQLTTLRENLAKYEASLRLRSGCVMGGTNSTPPWCTICKGRAPRETPGKLYTVDDIQHEPDCPVTLATEAAKTT